jgi:hypothetical protein
MTDPMLIGANYRRSQQLSNAALDAPLCAKDRPLHFRAAKISFDALRLAAPKIRLVNFAYFR